MIALTAAQSSVEVGQYVSILEDPDHSLDIEDVVSGDAAHRFNPSESAAPNFGFTSSAYWIRMTVQSTSSIREEWYLELAYPALDHITAYIENSDGEFAKKVSGDRVGFKQRDIAFHNFVFKFATEPGEIKQIYLRAESKGPVQLPLTIWTPDGLVEKVNKVTMGLGLYYGIMLVVSLYNLFLFITIRDKNYLYYVLYVLSYTAIQMCFNGLVSEYVLPEQPHAANLALLVSLGAALIFAGIFTRGFLQSKTTAPIMDRVIAATIIITALTTAISPLIPYGISLRILSAMVLVGLPILILAGIRSWMHGYMPARFYVIAWVPLIIGGVLYAMRAFGLAPNSLIATYGSQIGSALEVILLSLALGNRINYERRERFQAQKQAMENLKESEELKDSFMFTVSHELKTPVHVILRALDLLGGKSNLSKDDMTALTAAENSAYKMQQLVDDVICFADAQKQQPKAIDREFGLKAALHETIAYYRNQCQAKNIEFSVRYNGLDQAVYRSDPHKLTKVVCHLLDNAVKFTDKGSVAFELSEDLNGRAEGSLQDVALRISVIDTGTGIPAETQQEVYQSFRQADRSFTRKYGGMGIGLALCDTYVRAMGGEISFDSGPQGTRFDVSIPAQRVIYAHTQSQGDEATGNKLNPTVMVVEDNPVSQLLLVKLLKQLRYRVIKANNGKEAVELFRQTPVDVILMDCQMPVMDGYEASKQIRQLDASVPIIAVTANTLESDQERCSRSGMSDFVPKPVRKGVIEKTLEEWGAPVPAKNEVESPHPEPTSAAASKT
ncbi:MAG: 7TM diverse intracellular signaling domain-containing protein [Ketobacteraceae bacterium]|nr:7TM diverse intracellular signaling domain-containing protein [Ketobacteraceae bacterium]